MRPTHLSLKRSLLLGSFAALSLFSTAALAQDRDTPTDAATPTTAEEAATSKGEDTKTTAEAETTSTNKEDDEKTTSSSAKISITRTATDDETTSTAASAIPSITGGTSNTAAGPSNLPTLTGIYNTYSYPAPSVPPTENAPFMQRSTAPDGTVFIAVGAILGAFGAAVLIWRGIVACLLHRSVERAAVAQHAANDKATLPAQFYKYSDHESKMSLAANARRTTRGPIPSSTPSQTNLFFSPTAPGGSGHQTRDSRASFLPSGFYAAGGSTSPQQSHGHSISLSNLRPSSRGQVVSMAGPSPPDSPAFGPTRSPHGLRNVSSSSLNRPPSQRAPSAFLEDLLDENPNAFPPQGGVPPMPPPAQPGQHGRY